jgi:sulfatase maturation enzyme AslB (radical SAM superfamily)
MLLTSAKNFLLRRRAGAQLAVSSVPTELEPMSTAVPILAEPVEAPAAGQYEGWVVELSAQHAHGWVHDRSQPGKRLDYEVVLPNTGEVLASGCADQFRLGLSAFGVGDGAHAFWTKLNRPLSEDERAAVVMRTVGSKFELVRPPNMVTAFEPVWQVAMDVVDNCNLRCPFCLYDYEHTRTTHFMAPETLEAALRFLPYTKDGEFWFSCLHEPTLHPELISFIERVPVEYRRKLFFTTNLAKRMPADYFDWLASNGMHHCNVSIESRDPALYERMRKGARHRIFQENWEVLMGALARARKPTPIRYIAMAYKSNLRELPELTRYLIEERQAAQVELRYTYDVKHLPLDFRTSEFLDDAEWTWLEQQLAGLPGDKVVLLRPPLSGSAPGDDNAVAADTQATSQPADLLPGALMFRLSWDGTLVVRGVLAASRYDNAIEHTVLETNIRDIADPLPFFDEVMTGAKMVRCT